MWARFGDGRFHALKPSLSINRDNAQNAHGRGFESNRLVSTIEISQAGNTAPFHYGRDSFDAHRR
jgi:hypothetical protein